MPGNDDGMTAMTAKVRPQVAASNAPPRPAMRLTWAALS